MMYLFLYAIFSFPLIMSFYFSYAQNIPWLLGSFTFLFLTSSSLLSLSAQFKKKWAAFLFALLPLLLIFLFEIIQLISFYFQGEGFNERFFFHFSLNTIQEAGTGYPWLIFSIIFMLLFFMIVIYLCTRCVSYQNSEANKNVGWVEAKRKPTVPLLKSGGFPFHSYPPYISIRTANFNRIPRCFKFVPLYLSITALLISPFLDSAIKDFVNKRFLTQNALSQLDIKKLSTLGLNEKTIMPDQLSASPGKNLVLIYLESLERLYLDESVFKGLTPTINQLLNDNFSFTNISQIPGTEWTMAGIVASQCGTPLLSDNSLVGNNDIIQNGFLTEAICLGDVLHQAGYVQSYLGGASNRFAGKGGFLKAHHYDEVKGYDELKSRLQRKKYRTGLGLYDDSLFKIAEEEYVRLANLNKPFNLTLLTLDTHHPKGHPSQSCTPYPYQKNSILDAVHCTNQLLARFLNRLSRHPSAKETVVVLFSDHLAMRNEAENFYPAKYDRKLLFSILNTSLKGVNHESGSHTDIAPTILGAMGVKHNAPFLAGRNLLAQTDKFNHPDFSDAETMQMIRYVNSNIFTKGNESLCGEKYLAINENTPQTIKIGNKRIYLSLAGKPVAKHRFKKDLAILTFIDDKGSIKGAAIIFLGRLPYILAKNKEKIFLLITPNKNLPHELNNADPLNQEAISVLFGRFDRSIINLGHLADLQHLQIENSQCEKLIREAQKPSPQKRTALIFAGLCPNNSQYTALYTRESKQITIPRVGVEDVMTKVTLIQKTSHQFVVKEASSFNPIIEPWNYCHAYYADGSLYIPSILIDGVKHRLEMKKISDEPLTFEINEEAAAWFTTNLTGF